MLKNRRVREARRGDTIVEVLFAITVFSMVAIGGLTIMNQGTGIAQRALEITLVRQQIDAQAEALRFVHDAYMATYNQSGGSSGSGDFASQWRDIRNNRSVGSALSFDRMIAENGRCVQSASVDRNFVMNPKTAQVAGSGYTPADTHAQIRYNSSGGFSRSDGLWVQAVRQNGSGGAPGYIDFHIRACWDSPGQSVPVTLGTIVRLYDPAL